MWVLVGVILTAQAVGVQPIGLYNDMAQCFSAREAYMQQMPKPKVNYEMVCIQTNLFTGV